MKEKQWCKKHSRTYYDSCPECMKEIEIEDKKVLHSAKDKKIPFALIKETDSWILYTCPDCNEDTLCYLKLKGRQHKGEWACSNEAYHSHPYLDKYLKDNQ
jgi:hypothetical protein